MEENVPQHDEEEAVEITNIPGDPQPARLPVFHQRTRRSIGWLLVTSTFIMALLLLNAVGGAHLVDYVKSIFSPEKQISYAFSQTVVKTGVLQIGSEKTYLVRDVSPTIAPKQCPAADQVDSKQTIGAPPIWLSGFVGPNATLRLKNLSTVYASNNASHGLLLWGAHLQLIVQPGFKFPITLSFPSANGQPVPTFGFTSSGQKVTQNTDGTYSVPIFVPDSVTLAPVDPTQVPMGVKYNGGISWDLTIYFFKADCYSLLMDWGSGKWRANFAVGS